jgi:hypothetical protein
MTFSERGKLSAQLRQTEERMLGKQEAIRLHVDCGLGVADIAGATMFSKSNCSEVVKGRGVYRGRTGRVHFHAGNFPLPRYTIVAWKSGNSPSLLRGILRGKSVEIQGFPILFVYPC